MQVVLSPNTPGFSFFSFERKLYEEVEEVYKELIQLEPTNDNFDELLSEVFDVMQVCYSFLRTNFKMCEIEDANIIHLNKMREKYAKD